MPTSPAALPADFKTRLQDKARELGFAACGVAAASESQTHGRFVEWLDRDFHATMNWIARPDAVEKRADVARVLANAKSVICVAMHYRTSENWDDESCGKVARYARGDDYHDIIPKRLRELLAFIQEIAPCNGRVYSDTVPILERELAQRAGIGWIGKNTMLMSRELGSYFLLGEILLDIEIAPDAPHLEQFCGSCTRCLDACPTQAFDSPGVLNANKCISFHTIENRSSFPPQLRDQFGDWLFGCDVCQEVCPWNAKSKAQSDEPQLWTRDNFPTLLETLMMPPDEFSRRFKGSPIKRTKRRGLRRNAVRVLSNRRKKIVMRAA